MKKMLMALLMALLCMVSACALADGYTLGDKVEDFTATLSDGSTFTLSEALKEKKAVLLNFWASWCSPCKLEMPAMETAYERVSDDVAFVCLSIEGTDTNDTIASLRDSLGLDTLPMGLNGESLFEKFDNPDGGIPFTVVIDRNGVLAFSECGAVPDANKFVALMNVFSAEDYTDTQIVYEMPSALPDVEEASEEDMRKAIGAEGMEILSLDDSTIWPFIISEDGTYAYASNYEVKDSFAALVVQVEAKAGEGVGFEFAVNDAPHYQVFGVSVDNQTISLTMDGNKDWTDNAIAFDEDGVHSVAFVFQRDSVMDGEAFAAIRNVRKVTAEEIEAIKATHDQGVKTLEGETAEIETLEGDFKVASIEYDGDEIMQQNVLVDGSSVKVRIRVGKDVDMDKAILSDNSEYMMLGELEHDDEGYLYTPSLKVDENDLSSMVGRHINVYASVEDVMDEDMLDSYTFQVSAETMNNMVEYIQALLGSVADAAGSDEAENATKITWSWADGSAKEEKAEEAASTLNSDGTANYTVMVTDKEGRGMEKVMVQVCTTETCQVYWTDADGMAQFTDAPYPYEVHLLKVPEGYAKPEQTYLLAKEGGSLIIELDAE